jgi:hypothetical protein
VVGAEVDVGVNVVVGIEVDVGTEVVVGTEAGALTGAEIGVSFLSGVGSGVGVFDGWHAPKSTSAVTVSFFIAVGCTCSTCARNDFFY